MNDLTYHQVYSLTLDALQSERRGQYGCLATRVEELAITRGLTVISEHQSIGLGDASGQSRDRDKINRWVRHAMWACLKREIIAFGMGADGLNATWPFYEVTDYGMTVLKEHSPQPYDPDNFLEYFHTKVPSIDVSIRAYVEEAVTTFNAGCHRSAAVMLGCASEKLLLLFIDQFAASISDATKKAEFEKEMNKQWMISHKYSVVRNRLERMVNGKKLDREREDIVATDLPATFQLIRRCRNAGGHPDVPGDIDADTVFLNLRVFTEFARRVTNLAEHIKTIGADW